MKLISLNAWGGKKADDLLRFLSVRAKDTDVFCLQEVFNTDPAALEKRHPGDRLRADLFSAIRKVLPGHFASFASFDDDPVRMSLAMFIRHGIAVRTVADEVIHVPPKPQETGRIVFSQRKVQYAVLARPGRADLTIAHYHGLWVNGPKTDNPERLLQGHCLRLFLDRMGGSQVLCGDFNLLPENESLAVIGQGMRNLVIESGVTSTRTPLYRHHLNPAEPKFADYMLVTPDVRVHSFAVLPDQVSDHAALRLAFS